MKPGDKIKVKKSDGEEIKGILMPRSELSSEGYITIKLGSGYNIGIRKENIKKKEVVEEGEKIKYGSKGKEEITVDESLPTVALLGCGGTIASKIDYRTGGVYPTFSPGKLVEFVPELKEIANIKGKKLFDIFSEDMTPKHWQKIAEECKRQIELGVDGIVITQGTDTMHYTSAALSFMLRNLPVPVVITGAQRSSDRGSCDSRMNLLCSFRAATSDIAEVMICMHGGMDDTYCLAHQGTHVRKMHTSRRDAFQSINKGPYAKIWFKKDKIEYLRDDFKERNKRKVRLDKKLNPNVGLVWAHPGIKPDYIEHLKSYDGIVITGTGLGHVPVNKTHGYSKPIIKPLKELIKEGIPVVMTSQTLYGKIQMKVYSSGRDLLEAGVIPSYTLPEVALVKLMWVLGHTEDMKEVKKMMLRERCGEFNKRITLDAFEKLKDWKNGN